MNEREWRVSCRDRRRPGVRRQARIATRRASWPTKREGNRHANGFAGESVELDALPPRALKDMVREAIERHITPDTLATLRTAEQSERDLLRAWGDQFSGGAA